MNHKQKHTNLPMIIMTQVQHGGWYEYGKYYIDMDVPDPLHSMPESPQACLWGEWHPAKQGFLGGGQPPNSCLLAAR